MQNFVEPFHLQVCQRARRLVAAMVGMKQAHQVFVSLPDFVRRRPAIDPQFFVVVHHCAAAIRHSETDIGGN